MSPNVAELVVSRAKEQTEAQALALQALQDGLAIDPTGPPLPDLNPAQQACLQKAMDAVLRAVPPSLPVPLRIRSANLLLRSAWPSIEERLKELQDADD